MPEITKIYPDPVPAHTQHAQIQPIPYLPHPFASFQTSTTFTPTGLTPPTKSNHLAMDPDKPHIPSSRLAGSPEPSNSPDIAKSQQAAKFANVLLNFKLATNLATSAPELRHTTSAGGTSVLHNSNIYSNLGASSVIGPSGKSLVTNERVVVTNDESQLNNHRNIFTVLDKLDSFSDSAPSSPVSDSAPNANNKSDNFSYDSNNVRHRLALNQPIDLATLDQKPLIDTTDPVNTSFNSSVIYVSPETLLRAQKAKATFELRYDVICCFEGSTTWLGQEREPPRTDTGELIFKKYNPLQTIRNRKLRNKDQNRFSDSHHHELSDSPYNSRRNSNVSSGTTHHHHIPHPFQPKHTSPKIVWDVDIYELFTDLNWRVYRYNLMKDKYGKPLFPPRNTHSVYLDQHHTTQEQYPVEPVQYHSNNDMASPINNAEEIALESQIAKLDNEHKEPDHKSSNNQSTFEKLTGPVVSTLSTLPTSLNLSSSNSSSSSVNNKPAVFAKIQDKIKSITSSNDSPTESSNDTPNSFSASSTCQKADPTSTISLPPPATDVEFSSSNNLNNKPLSSIQKRFSNSGSGSLPNLALNSSGKDDKKDNSKESSRQPFLTMNPLAHLRKKSTASVVNAFGFDSGQSEAGLNRDNVVEKNDPLSLTVDHSNIDNSNHRPVSLQNDNNTKHSRSESNKRRPATTNDISWNEQASKQAWLIEQDKREGKELKELKEQKERKANMKFSVEAGAISPTVRLHLDSKPRISPADVHIESVKRKITQKTQDHDTTNTPLLLVNDKMIPALNDDKNGFKTLSETSFSDHTPSEKNALSRTHTSSSPEHTESLDSDFLDSLQHNVLSKKQSNAQYQKAPSTVSPVKTTSSYANRMTTNAPPATISSKDNSVLSSTLAPPSFPFSRNFTNNTITHTRAEHNAVIARQRSLVVSGYAAELRFLELVYLIRYIGMSFTVDSFVKGKPLFGSKLTDNRNLYDKRPGMVCQLQGPQWPKRKPISIVEVEENKRVSALSMRQTSTITELDSVADSTNKSNTSLNAHNSDDENDDEISRSGVIGKESLELLTSSPQVNQTLGSAATTDPGLSRTSLPSADFFDNIQSQKVPFICASQQKKEVRKLVNTILDTTYSSRNDVDRVRALLNSYSTEVATLRRTRISTTSTRLENLLVSSDQTLNKLSTTLNLEVKKATERMDMLERLTKRTGFWVALFGKSHKQSRISDTPIIASSTTSNLNRSTSRSHRHHNHNYHHRRKSFDNMALSSSSLALPYNNRRASTEFSVDQDANDALSSLLRANSSRRTANGRSHLSRAHHLSPRSTLFTTGGSRNFNAYTTPSIVSTIGYTVLEYTLVMLMWFIWGCASVLFGIKKVALWIWCAIFWLAKVFIWW